MLAEVDVSGLQQVDGRQGSLWAHQVGRMQGDAHVVWGGCHLYPLTSKWHLLGQAQGISLSHNKAGRGALWDGHSPPSGALSLEKQFQGAWAGQWEQMGHCWGAQRREGGSKKAPDCFSCTSPQSSFLLCLHSWKLASCCHPRELLGP